MLHIYKCIYLKFLARICCYVLFAKIQNGYGYSF